MNVIDLSLGMELRLGTPVTYAEIGPEKVIQGECIGSIQVFFPFLLFWVKICYIWTLNNGTTVN